MQSISASSIYGRIDKLLTINPACRRSAEPTSFRCRIMLTSVPLVLEALRTASGVGGFPAANFLNGLRLRTLERNPSVSH